MTDYTSAEFWKGAPEGATHYFAPFFYKAEGPRAWLFSDQWRLSSYSTRLIDESGVKRPAPSWSGDGLPPVGTQLECQYAVEGFTTWHAGECIAVGRAPEGEAMCVIKAGETITCCRAGSRMRPIKAPDQVAAEERAAAIEAMWDIYWQPSATSAKQALGLLWDAGLRLPKGDDQ